MYTSLKKLYSHFSLREKYRLLFIACVIVISALVQVVGIASIFPFISAAGDPQIVDNNEYLHGIKVFLSIDDNKHFIVLLGLVVLFTLILTNVFLAFSSWLTVRFVCTTNRNLAMRLLHKYLNESYLFHLNRNSSELIKNATAEVDRVVNGGIMSAINLVSKGFTALCILGLLIAVDPIVALIVGGTLCFSYVLIYLSISVRLKQVGILVSSLLSDRLQILTESLAGVKDLKVLGREKYYLNYFSSVSQQIVNHQIFSRVAMELPKYLLETVAFGGILGITIYFLAVKNDTQSILPVISLYGLAGYRLMPALQGMFQSLATLKHDSVAVDLFFRDLQGVGASLPDKVHVSQNELLPLTKELVLNKIGFNYPRTSKKAVDDVSLTIKANSSIGIIGTSGSGKSTLVDILLGLLEPQQGSLLVDGEELNSGNLRLWQNNIGYVPQVIFLADSTIIENIAFGMPSADIDLNAVETAAKMANLHDFIISELDDGYNTIVGERGIRLSGGQRQRIGIARALYHNPSVLVLDEATSALDSSTEQAVMKAVYNLSHKKTIIMIAHRISTVQNCDNLLWLEGGKVRAEGRYEDLIASNVQFKQFVNNGTDLDE